MKSTETSSHDRYNSWLGEVTYITTGEETRVWKNLQTDAQRERFIEEFGQRRNPQPGSSPNKFKQEYYRRLAYAQEHFAPCPGQTDERCRIYIQYGPPDEIRLYPDTPVSQGHETSAKPVERWIYRCVDGIGQTVSVDYVDPANHGERHVMVDPASLRRPTAWDFGLTTAATQPERGCVGVTDQR